MPLNKGHHMIYVIIPARYHSTRFLGKPLAIIAGKTMIQRVYEQAQKATLVDSVLVATDNKKIEEHVKTFGGMAVLTSPNHISGTDRLAEVVYRDLNIDIAVNVQGDEPIISPESIDLAIKPLLDDPDVAMTTLIRKCQPEDNLNNWNSVKVVIDKEGYAMYFSRSCIPFVRNKVKADHYIHVGLYAYKRDTLLKLSNFKPPNIEKSEDLEQLRALYNGIKIKTVLTDYYPISVDVPEDIAKVEAQIKKSRCLMAGDDGVS